jgi:hypothetical protein
MAQSGALSGDEVRTRIKRLGLTYARAADQLGLTLDGLNKQMRGDRPVSRQTEIILDQIEELRRLRRTQPQGGELPFDRSPRRKRA